PMDPVDATGPMRLVLCAFPNDGSADAVVEEVLRTRLAACVNTVAIGSRYWWKGSIESADETLLVFKTVPKRVGALFRLLAERHPYEVPEMIEIDVPRVNDAYLAYLAETIDRDAPPLPLGGGRAVRSAATRPGSRRGRGARRPARTRAPRRRP
ncbi:MAG: divalent-cation tolerance protein CutA, partial [Thermoplasmata archaeon]|nr:divalent-cation tolerance protein CutA [Thermoplasmata archaeon]